VPRLTLDGVNRQTGQLVIVRGRHPVSSAAQRSNISELDSRTTGGQNQGTLAFRILHQDWALDLTVEKLDPWITGQILQDVTLREGQTRTVMYGRFKVEQASIRNLRVKLPVADGGADTVRAIGESRERYRQSGRCLGDPLPAQDLRRRRCANRVREAPGGIR